MPLANISELVSNILAHKRIRVPWFRPYSSAVAARMAREIALLSPAVRWFEEVKIQTPFGCFYVDVAGLVRPGHAIGFECDGGEFHKDHVRDFCRDALILETKRIARIYRLKSWAITKDPVEWRLLIASLEPDMVCKSKRLTLLQLATANSVRRCPLSRFELARLDVQKFLAFAFKFKGSFVGLVNAWKESNSTNRKGVS